MRFDEYKCRTRIKGAQNSHVYLVQIHWISLGWSGLHEKPRHLGRAGPPILSAGSRRRLQYLGFWLTSKTPETLPNTANTAVAPSCSLEWYQDWGPEWRLKKGGCGILWNTESSRWCGLLFSRLLNYRLYSTLFSLVSIQKVSQKSTGAFSRLHALHAKLGWILNLKPFH